MLTRPVTENRLQRAVAVPPSTTGDAMGAMFDMDTLTTLLTRQGRIHAEESRGRRFNRKTGDVVVGPNASERVAPEVLNERYRDLGLKFDAPMTEASAAILADGKKAEIIRNDVLSRAPAGIVSTIQQFGAGLAATALDPLELATAFVPLMGPTRMIAATARLGRVGGRAAIGVAEGAAGNALLEPIYYGLSRQQQLDYGMSDALLNIGLGGVLGGVVGAGSGVFARSRVAAVDAPAVDAPKAEPPTAQSVVGSIDAADGVTEVRIGGDVARRDARIDPPDMTPAEQGAALRGAVAQMAEGRPVSIAEVMIDMPKRGRRPDTIVDAFSRIGAKDDGGELRAMGLDKWHRAAPFRRKVIREDGASLDDAAMRLYEDGWFEGTPVGVEMDAAMRGERPQPDLVRPMLDMLDEDMRGRAVFRPGDADAVQRWEASSVSDASNRAAVRDQIVEMGAGDLPAEALDRVMAIMARDRVSLDDAVERYAIESEAMDSLRGDVEIEEQPDALRDSLEEDEANYMAMIGDMRSEGLIEPDDEAMIAAFAAMDAKVAAAGDVSRAFAACLAR